MVHVLRNGRRNGETIPGFFGDQARTCTTGIDLSTAGRSWRLPLVLALLLVLPFMAQAQADRRLDALQLIQQGDIALRLGNSERALEHYTNAIQLDHSFADAYMKRASLLTRMGRYNEAVLDMDQALHYNPMSQYIHDRRAKVRILMSDYKGAELDIVQAQHLAPYDEVLRRERVDEWLDLGRPNTALLELDTLIQEHPHDTLLLLKKGFIHLAMNDLDSASVTAQRVLALNDRSAFAHDLRGLTLMRQGRIQEAIAAYTAAITIWPGFSLAYYNRSVAYRSLGMGEAALHDMDVAISTGQDRIHFLFTRSLVRKEVGDLEGAEADLSTALQMDPMAVDLLYNRSFARKHLGDHMGAMRDAEAALRMNSSDPKSWNLKGDLHLLFGEYLDAIEHYSRAINLAPDAAEHHYDRGLAYLMSYQLLHGCDDLRRSHEMGLPAATQALEFFCNF
jgi:tetratricopeptide (TPR) repeat protein